MDNRYDVLNDLIDNEYFYRIMNPYIESGILTEIYASYYISVFNLANKVYVTCPHVVLDDLVSGHLTDGEQTIREINDNVYAFQLHKDLMKFLIGVCYTFTPKRFDYWKEWGKNPEIKSETDPKFDEEIMKKYPKESVDFKAPPQQNSYIPPLTQYTDPVSESKSDYSAGRKMITPQYIDSVSRPKPTLLYFIAGVMAALQMLMFFLPHLINGSKVLFPIEMFGGAGALDKVGVSDVSDEIGVGFMVIFAILVVLEAAWAIMSFMRKKSAGIFGIVACAIGFYIHMVWEASIDSAAILTNASITIFPVFMIFISIAGIPVSIIQIVKKKYLD